MVTYMANNHIADGIDGNLFVIGNAHPLKHFGSKAAEHHEY